MLFLALTAITGFQIHPVLADVPSVLSIERWTSGTETILNITVRHSSPTNSHYVNKVEVDVDGAVHDIDLAPQSTVTFVVQYNMGELADAPMVRARAHCTIHGWSSWSNSEQVSDSSSIPLLPILAIVSVLAIVSIVILLLRSKVYGSKTKNIWKLPRAYAFWKTRLRVMARLLGILKSILKGRLGSKNGAFQRKRSTSIWLEPTVSNCDSYFSSCGTSGCQA